MPSFCFAFVNDFLNVCAKIHKNISEKFIMETKVSSLGKFCRRKEEMRKNGVQHGNEFK
ncbi:hypothetical protein BN1002_01877 [Bacillus sp. B-jedd]|nr:hypothetical protein BN1002_01877 [Bacillus sp. B-jedd]